MRKIWYRWFLVINLCCLLFLFMTGCQKTQNNSVDNGKAKEMSTEDTQEDASVGQKENAAQSDNTEQSGNTEQSRNTEQNGNTKQSGNTEQSDNTKQNGNTDQNELIFRDDLQGLFDNLTLAAPYKSIGDHNPLITQDFGADPFAMVYGDRVYVYMTQDVYMYGADGNLKENSYGAINSLRCISSSDLVNWTDQGWIHIGGIKGVSTWAKNSWAPTAIWKNIDGKDQFFVYFANGAGGIGVLTSDSPTGPFRDPLGKALITNQTPNCSNVVWLFDPAVFTDNDGNSYLYFGGGIPEGQEEAPKTARVIELGADMISTVGEAVSIDAPYMFEDSGINKIGETYCYTYCSNFSSRANAKGSYVPDGGEICYMTSDNPLGPWQYQGGVLKNPGYFFGTGGNNHHSMVQFNDKWYMFYHTSLLQDAIGVKGGYRSTNVNEVTINSDGSIKSVQADKAGVEQLKTLNPYESVAAATMSNNGGISVVEENRKSFKDPQVVSVSEIENGDWIQVSGVDFGAGAVSLTLRFSCEGDGGAIKVCRDSLDGEVITYTEITNTGSYNDFIEITVPVKEITGVHDIYFEFAGSGYHFNSWSFQAK
ncbi:MAG TPA: glycoside hydrolase family 43 protein [Mobilitalea sp.]|nr:glycoside hydrolase family 43 protein [Mobilitalea sp.]